MNKPFPATKDAPVKSFIIYFIYIFLNQTMRLERVTMNLVSFYKLLVFTRL